jgi:hypothetical protein
MLNKRVTYFFLFLAFSLSCSQEVEIDLPKPSKVPIINCIISPFELPYVEDINAFIFQSSAFLDTGDWVSIDEAYVRLINADTLVTNFLWVDSLKKYISDTPPFLCNIKEGLTYTLEVDYNNKTYSIKETIPNRIQIIDYSITPYAGVDEEGFIFSRITINFKDSPSLENFYEIQLRDNPTDNESNKYITSDDPSITSEPYYPATFSLEKPKPKYLPFCDKSFDGEEKQISFYYTPPTNNDKTKITGHDVFLLFRTVSENYYKYRTSLMQQEYSRRENILYGMAEPFNVYSNIEGGYGIFAATTNDYIPILIADSGKVYEK